VGLPGILLIAAALFKIDILIGFGRIFLESSS